MEYWEIEYKISIFIMFKIFKDRIGSMRNKMLWRKINKFEKLFNIIVEKI